MEVEFKGEAREVAQSPEKEGRQGGRVAQKLTGHEDTASSGPNGCADSLEVVIPIVFLTSGYPEISICRTIYGPVF